MEKVMSVLKKLYQVRIKISRKGTPVLNWSVLFSAACVLFAPHMSIIGAILALIMGYEFSIDANGVGFGAEGLEETLKKGAENVRKAVAGAASAVKTEIEKADAAKKEAAKKEADKKEAEKKEAESAASIWEMKTVPMAEAAEPAAAVTEPAAAVTEPIAAETVVPEKAPEINAEVLEDLRRHEDSFRSNPAATTFHSAYSAAADSVPTLQFPTENPAEDVVPKHQASQG